MPDKHYIGEGIYINQKLLIFFFFFYFSMNIYGMVLTVFTLSIRTPQLLTIYVLKFEPVQFTTRCFVKKMLDEWQTV